MRTYSTTSDNDLTGWTYEVKGPFCSTLFVFNGTATTEIFHKDSDDSGLIFTLRLLDTHLQPFSDMSTWISWCKEYVVKYAVR